MWKCTPRGIMFHHFIEKKKKNLLGAITPEHLESIILSYGRKNILPAREWFDRALTNSLCSDQVCITFDDALRSQINLALPVLKKHDLTAFWFIYSSVFQGEGGTFEVYRHFYDTYFQSFEDFFEDFLSYVHLDERSNNVEAARRVFNESNYLKEYTFYSDYEREYRFFRDRILGREKYGPLMERMLADRGLTRQELSHGLWMNNDDLLDLIQNRHIIGLHSNSHPTDLVSMSYADQAQEYQTNARHIAEVTGYQPKTVAHPVNSYGSGTLEILASMGVKLGFRSNMEKTNFGPLEHPREDCVNLKFVGQ